MRHQFFSAVLATCFAYVATLSSASSMSALPTLQPEHRTPFLDTVSVIYQRDEHGNLIKKDPRMMLRDLVAEHVSDTLKRRMRINTGFVYCKAADRRQQPLTVGSGFLFGNGMQVMTAGHLVLDKSNHIMPKCWFRSRELVPQKVELDMTPGTYLGFAHEIDVHWKRDLMLLRLKTPVRGSNPFPLAGSKPGDKRRLILLAAAEDDLNQNSAFDRTELIATTCREQKVLTRDFSGEPITYTDCSSMGGASGGPLLTFQEGRWVVVGELIRGTKEHWNFEPYSDDVKTTHIAFDDESLACFKVFETHKAEVAAIALDGRQFVVADWVAKGCPIPTGAPPPYADQRAVSSQH